jgi:nucleotidyltransferase-like protein
MIWDHGMLRGQVDDPKLHEAVSRLVEALHPRAIILFGSRARGTHRADSDYDLLVVSDEVRDYDEVYRPIAGQGLHCDVVPCSLGAWKGAALDSGGVLRAALDDGVLLYGEP